MDKPTPKPGEPGYDPYYDPNTPEGAEIAWLDKEQPSEERLRAMGFFEDQGGTVYQPQWYFITAIASELKTAREEHGWTLDQAAEKSGVSRVAISKLENARHLNPTLDTLYKIAAIYGKAVKMELIPIEDDSTDSVS